MITLTRTASRLDQRQRPGPFHERARGGRGRDPRPCDGGARGFGSVRVEACIRDVTWRTSVFPVKSGGYFLPVKIAVCRAAGISDGDEVGG